MRHLLLSVLLLWASTAGAHSGGTDASGCHTNHSTGDYHCHGTASGEPGSPGTLILAVIAVAAIAGGIGLWLRFGDDSPPSRRSCADDDACPGSLRCVDGRCAGACDSSLDCPTGHDCRGRRCVLRVGERGASVGVTPAGLMVTW